MKVDMPSCISRTKYCSKRNARSPFEKNISNTNFSTVTDKIYKKI